MAVSFVTIMYWNQFLTLIGLGSDVARFEIRFKSDAIPTGYLIALFSSIILLPYSEELWRCIKAAGIRRRQAEALCQVTTSPAPSMHASAIPRTGSFNVANTHTHPQGERAALMSCKIEHTHEGPPFIQHHP